MKKILLLVLLFLLVLSYFVFWPLKSGDLENFTVGLGEGDKALDLLFERGFIRNKTAMSLIMTIKGAKLAEGGYKLSKNMSLWNMASVIKKGPTLKWVVVAEGLRKEQIGERLAKAFSWNDEETKKWNEVYTRMKYEYREGVYFPDTYLIPVDEGGLDIANRMIARFNEKFAPFSEAALSKNIQWTTVLKIASLIQREAGGKDDMGIISGVIWNRLDKGMRLQIDATIQYAKGKVDDSWWSHVDPEDLKIDSDYNDYLHAGLPPTPICNPGLDAIEAAINPSETDCLFYLHDSNKQIHCAKDYEEHLENVQKYLQ